MQHRTWWETLRPLRDVQLTRLLITTELTHQAKTTNALGSAFNGKNSRKAFVLSFD